MPEVRITVAMTPNERCHSNLPFQLLRANSNPAGQSCQVCRQMLPQVADVSELEECGQTRYKKEMRETGREYEM